MNTWEALITIAGLVAITLGTRGFFLLPERELPLPAWLKESLRYAPLGALVALIAPDLLLTHGRLIDTWRDPRLAGFAAATLWYLWRRDLLGTIVAGTSVMLLCRLGLGW